VYLNGAISRARAMLQSNGWDLLVLSDTVAPT
jgi:hypothetical protein